MLRTLTLQVTARKNKLPLDNMSLDTHVTRMRKVTDATTLALYPEDGIFVHGLLIEGARWTDDEEAGDMTYLMGGENCPRCRVCIALLPSFLFECWVDVLLLLFYIIWATGTPCAGHLTDSRLKQLLTPMPIIYVKAVQVQPDWSPESVGYIRGDDTLYECPVYLTSARGPTFVFLSTLRTKNPVHRWVLAGVALLMQSDD